MSNRHNTQLIEHAVELAEEIEQRFEDDSYQKRVALLANATHVDMDMLDTLVYDMKAYLRLYDGHQYLDGIKDVTIW